MSEKWEGRIMLGGILILVGIVVGVLMADKENTHNKEVERCQAYCNCSITQDCPYTFDYDEVKGCDCK